MAITLKSVFKSPDSSVTVGLAEAAVVYVIYQNAVPNHTDIRSANPHNTDVETARKMAAWKSGAIIGLVFLMTQDINSALIGGAALAGMDLMVKHANGTDPSTGKLAGSGKGAPQPAGGAGNETAFPLPDYGQGDDGSSY